MYPFVTHTWNPIKGKCPHDCSYCYMKRFKVGELRIDDKYFKDDLGSDNFIFIGSSTDMWANKVPKEWIIKVLNFLPHFPDNIYLFQTKNPKRYNELKDYLKYLKKIIILGTTIETNMDNLISKAPSPRERAKEMSMLEGFKTMASIEPIENFNLNELLFIIKGIEPKFVSIGADSKKSNLIEPSESNIKHLIKELRAFTEVKIKDNLARLCPSGN